MTFQNIAGFLQWFVLYKLLAFSYEICPMGQILLGGSVACPAPDELVGAVVREPFGLPAHIPCVGYHSSITVVLHILKYLLFHVVTQHNVVFTSDAFWEWGYSFLDWEWRWKSMNIPTLQIQTVCRVGTKSKVARKPTLKTTRGWFVICWFPGDTREASGVCALLVIQTFWYVCLVDK